MFQVHLGDTPHNLSEKDFEDLARKTDGFSGSDVAVAVSDGPNILLCKMHVSSLSTWSTKTYKTSDVFLAVIKRNIRMSQLLS
jgi:hypothetical protein